MRQSVLTLALLGASASALAAQQPVLQAQPSPRATTVVNLEPPRGTPGATRISIDYGQPSLRGRSLAQLAPADRVWRFGANPSTTFETGVDLMIGNVHVPAGKYSLYALPTAAGWKLIINKQTGQWGTVYDDKQDLARIDLIKRTLQSPVETFTVWLIPSSPQSGKASGELRFAWGTEQYSTTWTVH